MQVLKHTGLKIKIEIFSQFCKRTDTNIGKVGDIAKLPSITMFL